MAIASPIIPAGPSRSTLVVLVLLALWVLYTSAKGDIGAYLGVVGLVPGSSGGAPGGGGAPTSAPQAGAPVPTPYAQGQINQLVEPGGSGFLGGGSYQSSPGAVF